MDLSVAVAVVALIAIGALVGKSSFSGGSQQYSSSKEGTVSLVSERGITNMPASSSLSYWRVVISSFGCCCSCRVKVTSMERGGGDEGKTYTMNVVALMLPTRTLVLSVGGI